MNKYMMTAGKHWKLLSLFNGLLLAITVFIFYTAEKTWTAEAKLILPTSNGKLNTDLGKLGSISSGDSKPIDNNLNTLKVLSSIMTSTDVLRSVWQQDIEKEEFPRIETYSKLFKVTPENESTIITLEVEGSSPELAKNRASILISALQSRLGTLRTSDSSGNQGFIGGDLERANQELQQAEDAFNTYRETSGLVNSDDQSSKILSSIQTITTTKAEVASQARAAQAKVSQISTRLGMTPQQAIQALRLGESSEYIALRQELSQVEKDLAQANSRFSENSPQIQSLIASRAELSSQLAKYGNLSVPVQTTTGRNKDSSALIQELILADSAATEYDRQEKQLEAEINTLNQQLRQLPAKQQTLAQLQRKLELAESKYNILEAKVQESKLNEFSAYPNIQLLDAPNVDPQPTKPRRKLIALGSLLAAGFGSAAIVLFLNERTSLLDITDIDPSQTTILGKIPELKQPEHDIKLDGRAVVEFQRLASAISLMKLEKNRLMIGSTTAEEGKTTVVLGTAYALNTLGFRVLLVDADFHKGELSQRLGYSYGQESNSIHLKAISIAENLDLCPTLPQRERIVEFVASGNFAKQLEEIQNNGNYDYIIVDSPPVGLTSESLLIARIIGKVLFVVRPGLTSTEEFYHSVNQVKTYESETMGIVVNRVKDRKNNYKYYGYEYQAKA